jgi:hypothetical protein
MRLVFSSRPWLGVGLLLALGAVLLGIGSLGDRAANAATPTRPLFGLPGHGVPPRMAPSSNLAVAHTGTMTHTAFLPLVTRALLNLWRGEYYANPTLSGEPEYTTQEARVDYDWGAGGSPAGLPTNRFSVRWTGSWEFEAGKYTFFLLADDGVRLWLDGQLKIDAWTAGSGLHLATVDVATGGSHHVRLEYFENTGEAAVRLHWRRTDFYPQWQGNYYNQPWVEDGWQYSHLDPAIEFDWGLGCPAGLPCDSFSVAWTARPLFEPGTHRIFLYADEGYQLYVDGSKRLEGGWDLGQPGGAVDTLYLLETTGTGFHNITYNMHDQGTLAEARLWIEHDEGSVWKAEYYANPTLSGEPDLVKYEHAIFNDWGLDKARPHLPSADNFSIRWTRQQTFHAGCYRFGLFADDGVRLWVDGQLLVDQWHSARATYYSPATYLSTGVHEIIVEYYEGTGEAEIRFWWE